MTFLKDEKFILYVQTSDNPERQYSPLVLAQTAKAMGLNPKVYYLGQALRILHPGAAEKIKLGSFPSVAEMLQKTSRWELKSTYAKHQNKCSDGPT